MSAPNSEQITLDLLEFIKQKKQKKPILIMTHLVLGYPDFSTNFAQVSKMVEAGVDLIELQIPFSEPSADGPTIVKANHLAIAKGLKIKDCLDFAKKVTSEFPKIAFIFMSYTNILFANSIQKMLKASKLAGIKGWIVPDLTLETPEAQDYLNCTKKYGLAPIFIITPLTSAKRIQLLSTQSKGMLYAVARKGVTGKKSIFNQELNHKLAFYKQNTNLPLAVGFGITSAADFSFLKGKADIAVIGTKLIQILETNGIEAVKDFLTSLS